MVGVLSKIFLLLWCFSLVQSIHRLHSYKETRHYQHNRPFYHRHNEESGRGPYFKYERGPYKKRPSYHEKSEYYHRDRYNKDKHVLEKAPRDTRMRFEKNDKRSPPKPNPMIHVKEEEIETNNIKIDIKPGCEKYHHMRPDVNTFQPLNQRIEDFHDFENCEHDHGGVIADLPDFSKCPKEVNHLDKYLLSLDPKCPLMTYQEANTYCAGLGMRALTIHGKQSAETITEKFDIAKLVPKSGFWTLGFLDDFSSDFVMWNDRIDTISKSGLWALREPSTSNKMCVKIALTQMRNRLTGTLDKLGRLHSEACPKKLPVVCEKPSL